MPRSKSRVQIPSPAPGFLETPLKRYSPLAAGLIIGVFWSVWHVPLFWDSVFSSFTSAAVVRGVFPDIEPPSTNLWERVTLVVVTVLVFVLVGRARLERKLEEAMKTLGDESIEVDR